MAEKLTYEKILELFAQTDAELKETHAMMRETDAKIAELAGASKKTEEQIEKMSKELGGMGKSNGLMAEEYFANSLKKNMTFGDMHFDYIDTNIKNSINGHGDEFDIVMYNGSAVALVEAKYKARVEDLQVLVTRKVKNFRTLFPTYTNYAIYLGLASMSFDNDTITRAEKLGVAILRQKGQSIEINTDSIRAY
ncbi:MAG: hypothetical protein Ta2A_01130 [Treponemataceae bacterium]|nr:MAG: hypothetical protein Ta2A_01130 [Treponemataceae bacterium]